MALAYELQLQQTVASNSAPLKLLGEVQAIMFKTDEAAVDAGRLLGGVAGISGDSFAKIPD
jgi:hypothetical protein